LCARERQIIGIERREIDIKLAGCLDRIDEQQRTCFPRKFCNLLQRLNRTRFVVGEHHGDDCAAFAFAQQHAQGLCIDHAGTS
jgi:hypothetical protein